MIIHLGKLICFTWRVTWVNFFVKYQQIFVDWQKFICSKKICSKFNEVYGYLYKIKQILVFVFSKFQLIFSVSLFISNWVINSYFQISDIAFAFALVFFITISTINCQITNQPRCTSAGLFIPHPDECQWFIQCTAVGLGQRGECKTSKIISKSIKF